MIPSTLAPPAVSAKHLTKSFAKGQHEEVRVLNDVSFDVGHGEILGIFGPSGCGKTTLLRILAGVLASDAGEVTVFGTPGGDASRLTAYVPQRTQLLDWLTLWDNALLGWNIGRRATAPSWRSLLSRPRQLWNKLRCTSPPDKDVTARAEGLFRQFGLENVSSHYPQQCSGGERQRAALIRALLTPAPLLALDEPVVAIDHITRVNIYDTLLNVVQESPTAATLVMISHDPEELLLICDRILIMSQRPSCIRESVSVPFRRPRSSDLRFSTPFVELKAALWRLLS